MIKYKEITEKTIKGFYEIYNELGSGFLESVYEQALYIVLTGYGLNVERQKDITVYFRSHIIGKFRADLIINEKIIVEIKAVRNLLSEHEAQMINYLKATNIEVGLLLNFGNKPVRQLADIYDNYRKDIRENLCVSVANKISVNLCVSVAKFRASLLKRHFLYAQVYTLPLLRCI